MTVRHPPFSHAVPRHRLRTSALAWAGMGLLLGASVAAQAQQAPVAGRVISSSALSENGRPAGYSVTYEYDGQQYTTHTDSPPGPTVPVETSPYGAATYPVAPQPGWAQPADRGPAPSGAYPVTPEPGVVVSKTGEPYGVPPAYPAPAYAAPAYAYPGPYVYPPVGISLNFGYARGWHRSWR